MGQLSPVSNYLARHRNCSMLGRRRVLLDSVDSIRGELNQLAGFRDIVGHSPGLLKILDTSARVASRRTPILITGESGTGKDLLARAIHENSAARNGAFVKITCGLLGSDSVRRSFLSSGSDAPSTVYLDEVTELPVHLQMELEHLLHEVEDGDTQHFLQAPLRVISSTSSTVDLAKEARLRPALYYRLAVVPIYIPPLRERKEDLPELAQFLADRLAKRYNLTPTAIPDRVHQRFARYHWPGNIRELENVIKRMILFAAEFELGEQELTTNGRHDTPEAASSRDLPENGLCLSQVERDLLGAALAKFGGNQTKAARYLNISRRTLIYRMGKYKLRRAANGENS